MIEIAQFEEVTQIRMSRVIDGVPIYWVSAYLMDGLLIDTGCDYTAEELAPYLDDKRLDAVINTHFHEDHIGCNYLIKDRFNVDVYAHSESIPLIRKKGISVPLSGNGLGLSCADRGKTDTRTDKNGAFHL